VARGDLNCPARVLPADRDPDGRRRGDAHVEDFAPGREQPSRNGVSEHFPARAGIPSHENRLSGADVVAERLGEPHRRVRGEGPADDPADAGHADDQFC
jgi:hypothetical protein